MHFSSRVILLRHAVLALAVSSLSACGGGGSGAGASTDQLSLAVTDAPIDNAESVVVTFDQVEVKPKSGSARSFVFDTPKTIDLLQQQGGNSAPLLTDESLDAGDYEWIRLSVVAEANVSDTYIVVGGQEHELDVPSGSTSGLKLHATEGEPITVPAGGSASFTIDFDLRHSIVVTGNNQYKLKPVLRLINNVGDARLQGTIDATSLVSAECTDASLHAGAVYLYSGHDITPDDIDGTQPDPIATAEVEFNTDTSDYEYTLAFLKAGNYTLSYTCGDDDADSNDTLSFVATQNVTLAEDETQTLNLQ